MVHMQTSRRAVLLTGGAVLGVSQIVREAFSAHADEPMKNGSSTSLRRVTVANGRYWALFDEAGVFRVFDLGVVQDGASSIRMPERAYVTLPSDVVPTTMAEVGSQLWIGGGRRVKLGEHVFTDDPSGISQRDLERYIPDDTVYMGKQIVDIEGLDLWIAELSVGALRERQSNWQTDDALTYVAALASDGGIVIRHGREVVDAVVYSDSTRELGLPTSGDRGVVHAAQRGERLLVIVAELDPGPSFANIVGSTPDGDEIVPIPEGEILGLAGSVAGDMRILVRDPAGGGISAYRWQFSDSGWRPEEKTPQLCACGVAVAVSGSTTSPTWASFDPVENCISLS